MLLFIITRSLNSLLPTRALCGCMDTDRLIHLCRRRVPLVLTAEVAGIAYKRFSQRIRANQKFLLLSDT